MDAMESPRITIWLVHGTWARHARWVREGSALRDALAEGLQGTVSFRTHAWTGRNRAKDRREAAERLLASVAQAAADADATFIIAHSHGGNVAVHAAAQAADRRARSLAEGQAPLADGVVTLNTPFLAFAPRDRGMLLIHAVALLLATQVLVPRFLSLSPAEGLLIASGILLAASVACFLWFALSGALVAFWTLLEQPPVVSGGSLSGTDVLSLCTPDDEALGWLEAVDAILNLPYLLLHKVALPVSFLALSLTHYVFRWDFLHLEWLAAALESGQPPAGFRESLLSPAPEVSAETVTWVSGWLYEEGSLVALVGALALSTASHFALFWSVLAIACLGTIYLTRGIAFGEGFGAFAMLKAFGFRLKVSPSPWFLSSSEVVLVPGQLRGWLRHSDIYANVSALRHMVDWMNHRIGARHVGT